MSTGIIETVEPYTDEYESYRAVSKSAVICIALGLISLSAWLTAYALFLPVIGTVFGLIALNAIRRYPDELTGRAAALIGIVMCVGTLFGGSALHAYTYATEVPEGCIRISFADLQPDPETPEMALPKRAFELNGKRIFIKGYVFPDGQQYDIKRFILVPDMGTCCFGGQPKLTDMIEVTLRDPLRVEFARRKRKFAGIFKVDGTLKPVSAVGGVAYQLDADYVR